MSSRPKQPQPRPAPRLYLVTPELAETESFAAHLTTALGAADIAAVLLRLEPGDERALINRAKVLAPVIQDRDAAFLLASHSELVARSGADGAHLTGMETFPNALEQLKPDRIVGIGGLETRHDAMVAAEAADYLMFGSPGEPIEQTLESVTWSAEVFELPCVAFASSIDQIASLVAAGADFVALNCIWSDARGVANAVAEAATFMRLPEPAA